MCGQGGDMKLPKIFYTPYPEINKLNTKVKYSRAPISSVYNGLKKIGKLKK
jgi:hypothetical protein